VEFSFSNRKAIFVRFSDAIRHFLGSKVKTLMWAPARCRLADFLATEMELTAAANAFERAGAAGPLSYANRAMRVAFII
jgi:hypothetical protein